MFSDSFINCISNRVNKYENFIVTTCPLIYEYLYQITSIIRNLIFIITDRVIVKIMSNIVSSY